jgi:glycosyltransferase involved in cell wall biosynthesis
VERTGGGLLVAPDDPEALAEGLHALWSHPGKAEDLGTRAFNGVRAHYTIAASATRLLDVYESVVAKRPTHGTTINAEAAETAEIG